MTRKILNYGLLVFIAFGVSLNYNISQIFLEERIVPEIIPVPPVNQCRVFYPFGEVIPGGNMTYNQSKEAPTNVTWPADKDSLYTIFLTGVTDWTPVKKRKSTAPAEVHGKEWHQWIVINIPGNNVTAGEVLYRYLPAGDPYEDEFGDIYVYLIYKQPGKLFVNTTMDIGWAEFQRNYRPYRFARRFRLGSPVAGTYYLTYYESYKGELDSVFNLQE